MQAFKAPQSSLGSLDADSAAGLIAAASDVALVLDGDGVIRDIAFSSTDLPAELEGGDSWVGRNWSDLATVESRPKVGALLREAGSGAPPRWRHINHPSHAGGADIPVLYSAVQVAPDGRIVAFGRDLRAMSVLQQRLVDAQQSMERDYSLLRTLETRYRLLFQMSSEAVLIVDATTHKVTEANPAAGQLLGTATKLLVGRAFADVFDRDSATSVQGMLAAVRTAGRAEEIGARLADGGREVVAAASLFRQDSASLLLVRLVPLQSQAPAAALPKVKAKLLRLVESAPDGFVVTTSEGRILTANAAFLEMAQLATEEQAVGESLDRWIGRPGVDLDVLTANLRQRGSVRLFATTVRGEYGVAMDVEISAVSVLNGGQPSFGFAIRNVSRRLNPESLVRNKLPRSAEQLRELIGRVPLKDLLRETTDVIERMCIEAALELTGDNRASAAEMLGLSRQSLYVKLRRYGLGDLGGDLADERQQ